MYVKNVNYLVTKSHTSLYDWGGKKKRGIAKINALRGFVRLSGKTLCQEPLFHTCIITRRAACGNKESVSLSCKASLWEYRCSFPFLLYWDAVSDSLALNGAGSGRPQVKAAALGSLCSFPKLSGYSRNIMNCSRCHSGCSLNDPDCQKILLPHLSLSSCSSCSCCKPNQQSKVWFYV